MKYNLDDLHNLFIPYENFDEYYTPHWNKILNEQIEADMNPWPVSSWSEYVNCNWLRKYDAHLIKHNDRNFIEFSTIQGHALFILEWS